MHPTNHPSVKTTAESSANFRGASVPLALFKSGQFLALTPECQGGLIIQHPFYADFVGPGAAVGGGFDVNCTSVYAIGKVEFYVPKTYAQRQEAFKKRIAYTQALEDILLVSSPLHRACLIIRQLSLWLGAKRVRKIPCELIAEVGGLLPTTVAIARRRLAKKNTSHSPRAKSDPIPLHREFLYKT